MKSILYYIELDCLKMNSLKHKMLYSNNLNRIVNNFLIK